MNQPGDPLTAKQQKVYTFIERYAAQHGRPPTIRDICKAFDIRSPNGAYCHLKALEQKGLITRDGNRACGIKLTSSGTRVQLTRDEIGNALKAAGMGGLARAQVLPFLCDRWGIA